MPAPLSNQRIDTGRSDLQACRTLLSHGSRSFHAASLLLPQPYRDGAVSLYAFCRIADDDIDLSEHPEAALEMLRQRLDSIYARKPRDHAADRALARTVYQFAIPRELLDALLEGFAWDCHGRHYDSIEDVYAYGARVAGSVGVMMALLMGQRDTRVLARAADLGVAMQLTNIARDVGEDARNGRLYLPRQWMLEAGIDPGVWLTRPEHSEALGTVVERLLTCADALYARAEAGIASLPGGCQPCVMTARLLYGEIGEEVRRRKLDAVSERAVVSPSRKCRVIAGLGRLGKLDLSPLSTAPLPQTRFLLEAVEATPLPAAADDAPAGKVEWMLDLFAELQKQDRRSRRQPSSLMVSDAGGGAAS